jgi:hypothetical protein
LRKPERKFLVVAVLTCALLKGGTKPACAQPASTTPPVLSLPAMAGPLAANPNPLSVDAGPIGKVYLTGVVSALAQWQTNPDNGDSTSQVDLSNGQVFVQKPDGLVQFFIHVGIYSLPSLGTAYVNASKTTTDLYGPLPEAFITLAPTNDWSIMAGKLPSLPGLEQTFTFQNMNVERGLLWNQTNSVNRGVQVNYSHGPVSLALSWNDGFYSDRFSWLSGSATWKVDDADQLVFVGAGNTRTTFASTTATPVLQNNSQMYNAMYTRSSKSWTLSPYLQYTYVPRALSIGVPHDLATYGAALLVNYTFDSASKVGALSLNGFSLPFRTEYIASSGSVAGGGLLYGPGSAAWSITVTPTYQYERFFARAEFSYVGTTHTIAGFVFGPSGSNTTQARLLLESGFLF